MDGRLADADPQGAMGEWINRVLPFLGYCSGGCRHGLALRHGGRDENDRVIRLR